MDLIIFSIPVHGSNTCILQKLIFINKRLSRERINAENGGKVIYKGLNGRYEKLDICMAEVNKFSYNKK